MKAVSVELDEKTALETLKSYLAEEKTRAGLTVIPDNCASAMKIIKAEVFSKSVDDLLALGSTPTSEEMTSMTANAFMKGSTTVPVDCSLKGQGLAEPLQRAQRRTGAQWILVRRHGQSEDPSLLHSKGGEQLHHFENDEERKADDEHAGQRSKTDRSLDAGHSWPWAS